jgi:hypothetical protein
MAEAKLISLADLEPAAYNPREADTERLRLLGMSLRKLGFILPLYADPDGRLLSGHQRLLTATNLNCTHAPVMEINPEGSHGETAKTLNVIFNRATNDMAGTEDSQQLLKKLGLYDLQAKLDAVPDKDVTSDEFFRCVNPEMVPLADLKDGLTRTYDMGAVSMATKLFRRGVKMNAVVNRDTGEIVNGNFRIMAAMENAGKIQGLDPYPVVYISNEEAELAGLLLNMISMRFTLEKQYADDLRFGSFRRTTLVVEDLTLAMRAWVDGAAKSAHESLANPMKFWSKFRKMYGNSVLDFGAGQRRQGRIFEQKGIRATEWEPYPCDVHREIPGSDSTRPNLQLARQVTDTFLEDVRNGVAWDGIFLSAVLNSVPFLRDRLIVLTVVHSLCHLHTKVAGTCRDARYKDGTKRLNRVRQDGKIATAVSVFDLDYEEDVVIGDINRAPKVQKYEHPEGMRAMMHPFFETVEIKAGQGKLLFQCQHPKRVNLSLLKTALLHEFNLPYPDGESLDRGQQALDAWGERLGVDFSKIEEA